MEKSRIILLNGASSAGKTTLARVLQNSLNEPYLYVSADGFLQMLPQRYFGMDVSESDIAAQGISLQKRSDFEGDYYNSQIGSFGHRLVLDAMNPTIAGLAERGFNIIVDTLLLDANWLNDLARLLQNFEVWFVQVYCPLDVLQQREIARGDRVPGQGRGQHQAAYGYIIYDLMVDTSLLTPEEAAEQIQAVLARKPTAFERLRTVLEEGA